MHTIRALSFTTATNLRAAHTDEAFLSGGGTHTPAVESLPADAAQELRELLAYVPRREQTVLRAYNNKGSLKAVGTMRLTPLHIAVMYQCVALTRELLRQGANPSATLKPQDIKTTPGYLEPPPLTPLLWLFNNICTYAEGYDANKINQIIDLLVQHGVNLRSKEGGQALYDSAATLMKECEEIFLHLLDLGARTQDGYMREQTLNCHAIVLYAGFERAARRLIDEGVLDINGRDVNGETHLTNALCAVGKFYACAIPSIDEETAEHIYQRNLISLRLLLEYGAEGINEVHPRFGAPSSSALCCIIEHLPQNAKTQHVKRAGELIQLLVQHGADLHIPISVEGWAPQRTVTAAEMIREKPNLASWLQQHGSPLPQHRVEGIGKELTRAHEPPPSSQL